MRLRRVQCLTKDELEGVGGVPWGKMRLSLAITSHTRPALWVQVYVDQE